MVRIALLLCLTLGSFFSNVKAQTCPGNLLQNAGFENGLNSWEGGGEAVTGGYSGSRALRACTAGVSVRQTLSATAGQTYTLNGFLKKDAAASGFVFMKFLSNTWQPLENTYANWQQQGTNWSAFDPLVRTAPAGTAWVEISVVKNSGSTSTSCFYADDLCLTSGGGGGGGTDCTTDLGAGDLLCTEKSGTNLIVRTILNGTVTARTLNASGAIVSTTNEGTLVQDSFLINGNQIRKKLANGTIAWTKTVPQSILDSIPTIQAFAELTTGELLLAGFRTVTNGVSPPSRSIFMTVKTSSSLTPLIYKRQYEQVQSNPSFPFSNRVILVVPLANGMADLLYQVTIERLIYEYPLAILRVNNNLTQNKIVDITSYANTSTPIKFYKTPCGSYFYDGPIGFVGQKGRFTGTLRYYIKQSDLSPIQSSQWGNGDTDYYGSYESRTFRSWSPDSLSGGYQYRPGVDPYPMMTFSLPQATGDPILFETPISPYVHAVRMSNNGLFLFEKTASGIELFQPVNCGGTTTNKPDLSLANLNMTNNNVPLGGVLNYTFDLKNTGLAGAAGNFNIKAYISTDNFISADDIQDGIVPTGNLAAGQTVTGVEGASTIVSSLIPGNYYYLILKVDADNQINENNETNNTIISSSPFNIASVGCNITPTVTQPVCNDAGTPSNPNDDTFSFDFTINNAQSSWVAFVPDANQYGTNTTTSGTNGQVRTLTYPIAAVNSYLNGEVNFNAFESQNTSCFANILAIAPATCSNTTPPPTGCTNNLLSNGGFESVLVDWTNSGNATSATGGANGSSKSASICTNGIRLYQTKAITAGKTYTFRAFAKNNGTAATGTLALKYMNASWSPLVTEYAPISATGNWVEYTVSKAAPAGAVWAEVSIVKETGAGCLLADDACLSESGGGSGTNCALSVTLGAAVPCNDNGTPNNASDDTYSFTATVSNTGNCGVGWTGGATPYSSGSFGVAYGFGQFPISGGNRSVTFTAAGDPSVSKTVTITAPPTCSNTTPPPTGCTNNLLSNGGFESVLVDWTNSGNATSATGGANGSSKSASICTNGIRLYQTKAITAGKTYTFRAFAKNNGTAATGTLALKYMNASWSPLVTEYAPISATGNWVEYTVTKAAPAGAVWAEVSIVKETGAGCLLADDACLSESGGGSGTNCALSVTLGAAVPCNDNGTPNNATDDTYSFTATVSNTGNCGVGWTGGATPYTSGSFGVAYGFGQFPISGGNRTVTFTAAGDPSVSRTVTITAPPTCSNGGGGTNLPDLRISNVVILGQTVQAGGVISYRFDLTNASTINITGNFNIKAYISTDTILSSNDIQDGIVPTGNFEGGLSVPQVLGATTIPTTLAQGTYFILLKADADNQVSESNENNNIAFSSYPIEVISSNNSTTSPCDKFAGNGYLVCAQPSGGTSTNMQMIVDGGQRTRRTFDANGNLLSTDNLGTAVPYYERLIKIVGGNTIEKRNADGSLVYSKPMPTALQNSVNSFVDVVEFGTGYVFLGWTSASPTMNYLMDSLIAVKTDANLNITLRKLVGQGTGNPGGNSAGSLTVVSADRLAFTQNSSPFSIGWTGVLKLMDGNFVIKSQKTIYSNIYAAGLGISANPCRGFTVTDNQSLGFCKSGGCYVSEVFDGEFVNDEFVSYNTYKKYHQTTVGIGTENYDYFTKTSDGGSIKGERYLMGNIYQNTNDTITLKRYNAAGSLLWTKKVRVPQASTVQKIIESNGVVYFLRRDESNYNWYVNTLNCLENSGGGTTGADLEITISGDKTAVPQWGNFSVTITAKNNGTQAIGSATVRVAGCSGGGVVQYFDQSFKVVYAGTIPPPSAGTYNYITQLWQLSNLAPGATATLTIPLFTTGVGERKIIAQSTAQSPNDPDSQPSTAALPNCLPVQDDEALWTINAGQNILQAGTTARVQQEEPNIDGISDFELFPNPTEGEFFVKLPKDFEGKLSVTNSLGQQILWKEYRTDTPVLEQVVLSGQPTGYFYVVLQPEGQRAVVKKLVVVRPE